MKEQRIEIKLPNGDILVAEECPYNGAQIAIGIVHENSWIQDLAVIETSNDDGERIGDKYDIYVYGSEYDECFTERFSVNRVTSDSL